MGNRQWVTGIVVLPVSGEVFSGYGIEDFFLVSNP
jgi:hypothetical protein